jgi:mannosyl-oligosaccharide alpha-1,3-glucosidase
MKRDPFTLRVALSKKDAGARGELYLDDGESYGYRAGQLVWREFVAALADRKVLRISSRDAVRAGDAPAVVRDGGPAALTLARNEFARSVEHVRVEKITVLGAVKPKSVRVENGKELEWEFVPGLSAGQKKDGAGSVLTIKDPGVSIVGDWDIIIQL